jgi:pimeloyl-ACP methyl ester carboxylesterase
MTQRLAGSFVAFLSSILTVTVVLAVAAPAAYAWQPAAKAKQKEPELPEPVEEEIEVKVAGTRLTLSTTYFPSPLGKEAVPVLLLHGYEGTRADYAYLAQYLHNQGHAVIVPDLRGHGDSTQLHLASGQRTELSAKKMQPRDFNALVADLDAVKSWLLQRNNAEELNMEALVVVGADMSTVTAMNFALRDWEAPELLNYKNCKDVKALVLLSPDQNYRGTSMKVALKHPVVGHRLSVMVAVGKKDAGALSEAKRLVTALERQHGEASAEKRPEEKEVVFYAADTNLQGTKLLDRNLEVVPIIAQFIKFRVQALADDFPYTPRLKP